MKSIIIFILIGISINYIPSQAISYARRYCQNYNTRYDTYPEDEKAASFVSQCLVAGGINFWNTNCSSIRKGIIYGPYNLYNCLTKIGWKRSTKLTKEFKSGYPFFIGKNIPKIATYVSNISITYCSHAPDRCDAKIQPRSDFIYFYP